MWKIMLNVLLFFSVGNFGIRHEWSLPVTSVYQTKQLSGSELNSLTLSVRRGFPSVCICTLLLDVTVVQDKEEKASSTLLFSVISCNGVHDFVSYYLPGY